MGHGSPFGDAHFDPFAEWWRPTSKRDKRLSPASASALSTCGGRRMVHPFHPDIVYPRIPDRTSPFGYDVLRRVDHELVRTELGTALAKFPEQLDDVVIQETWLAQSLSTLSQLFHQFHRYWVDTLPVGEYLGWQPRDLSPKRFFIELVDVQCGESDRLVVEELGNARPFYMRQALTLTFKLVREVRSPAGVMIGVGA